MKLSNVIYCGDNLEWMRKMPDEFVDLIYADPPFFSNRHYEVIFNDGAEIRSFEDRWQGGIYHYVEWMKERCHEIHRLLKPTGSFYLHCDWHAGHYLKIMLDDLFGMSGFRNEIVWCYRQGGRSEKYFPRKHDTIFWYSKSDDWIFNSDASSVRTDYHGTGGYQTSGKGVTRKETGATYKPDPRGKIVEDWWDIPALPPMSKERLGYPTQKPKALLERIVQASSNKEDIVFDPFCGCGTTLVVAQLLKRKWLGIDVSPTACKLMQRRLKNESDIDAEIIGLPMSMNELRDLDPFEFQNWIIGAMGGTPSKKKVHDMGIDGYTFFDRVPVQVKQSERVGRPVVDDFETALRRHGESALKAAKERKNNHFALQGIIVAFSFTKGAYEEVARVKGEGIDIQLLTVTEVVKEFET